MDALRAVGYAQQTLVLLTSDHGQNLGEHNTWTKMTNWEHSLRVPLADDAWVPHRLVSTQGTTVMVETQRAVENATLTVSVGQSREV